MNTRVPTGQVDEELRIGLDRTAAVPVLVLSLHRRPPSEVSQEAFRPVCTILIQLQYGELLLERIRQAIALPSPTLP